jgi:hypothetical protein
MAKYEAWGTVLWVRNRPDHIEVHIGGCEVLSAEIGMKTPGLKDLAFILLRGRTIEEVKRSLNGTIEKKNEKGQDMRFQPCCTRLVTETGKSMIRLHEPRPLRDFLEGLHEAVGDGPTPA